LANDHWQVAPLQQTACRMVDAALVGQRWYAGSTCRCTVSARMAMLVL
jgi:hypothetical protein